LANIARVAAGLGLQEIGLTDHVEGNPTPAADQRWQCTDMEALTRRCEQIRHDPWPLRLLSGWEVDYYDGGGYSFVPERHLPLLDYVLLAHHAVGAVATESPERIARYLLRVTSAMARDPYAHIIAHPFYFPPPPDRHGLILACLPDSAITEVFIAMREAGKAAEVTPYQFSADLRSVEQMRRVYSLARQAGVKFTLDSDAHRLWNLGEGLRCLHALTELGFTGADFVDFAGLQRLARP
jgi:histidinol phosphatase-like PHP family hydrolase